VAIKYRCAGQGYFGSGLGGIDAFGSCADTIDGVGYPGYWARMDAGYVFGAQELYAYVLIEFYDDVTGDPVAVAGSVKFEVVASCNWCPYIPPIGSVGWGVPQGSMFTVSDIVSIMPITISGHDEDPTYKDVVFFGDSKYAFFLRATTSGNEVNPNPDVPLYIWVSAVILELEFSNLQMAPVAAFEAHPLTGVAPLDVEFTDLSSDAQSWYWQFGDGEDSTDQHPIHVYKRPALYPVALTVANMAGQDSALYDNYIRVLPPVSSRRRRAVGDVMERPRLL